MNRSILGAALIAAGCLGAAACGSNVSSGGGGGGTSSGTGGAMCFNALSGPPSMSCVGYPLGLSCGFGDEPAYSCTCKKSGSTQVWDCSMSGPGSSSGSGAGGSMCHGDATAWGTITAKPLDCQQNADCCVVINTCLNDAQIVTVTDYMAATAAEPYCDNQCTNCIPPAIDVGCVNGKCVGQNLNNANPPPPAMLRQSHCGMNPVAMPAAVSHFTCGGP